MVTQEIKSLTGLRGVAAVYVVVFHLFLGLRMSNPLTTLLAHGYLAVDLFFVLSGYVMALNYGHLFQVTSTVASYRKFLGRRIARVYPLYLVCTLLAYLLVRAHLLEQPHFRSAGGNLLANLLMVQTWGYGQSFDPPAWSISAEFAAYLLFPLLVVPALFRGLSEALIAAFACLGILAALCYSPAISAARVVPQAPLDLHTSTFALPVIRCVAEFTLGLLAFSLPRFGIGLRLGRERWWSPLFCSIAIVALAIPGTDLIFVFALPLLVVSLASGSSLPVRLLSSPVAERLGTLSYSIYLVHDLAMGFAGWIHKQAAARHLAHAQSYAAAICFLLTFPTAYLSYTYIEAPGRRIVRHLFEPARSARFDEFGTEPARSQSA